MKILGVGGGTLGPVTPLLATWHALKHLHPEAALRWIGTPHGPEVDLLRALHVPFDALPVVKLPRYPSLKWLTFPFDWARARRMAGHLLDAERPDVVMSAGGFTAVPVVYAAAARGIPCVTHQLDLQPGLANRKIAPLCARVTTSFEYEHRPFGDAVSDEPIATPTRFQLKDLPSREKGLHAFGFSAHKPTILVMGGGSGSQFLNELIHQNLKTLLSFAQVLHSTGPGKESHLVEDEKQKGYHGEVLFQKTMKEAYAAADIVVARAGIGTLSEIAALKKPTILIPLPETQQEANAKAFEDQGAAMVVHQNMQDVGAHLLKTLELLCMDKTLRAEMGERAHTFFSTDDGSELARIILNVVHSSPVVIS